MTMLIERLRAALAAAPAVFRREFAARRNLHFLGFFLTILCILVVIVVQGSLPPRVLGEYHADGINTNSRFANSPAFRLRHYTRLPDGPDKYVETDFDFRAFASDTAYSDLFQTAGYNTAVRVEYAHAGTLAVVVGTRAEPSGFRAYVIPGTIPAETWHHLKVKLGIDHHLQVYLDGAYVLDETDPYFAVDVSDVAVGTGFDAARFFDGVIRRASVLVRVSEPSPIAASPLWKVLLGLLVAYNVVFLVLLGDRNRVAPRPRLQGEPS